MDPLAPSLACRFVGAPISSRSRFQHDACHASSGEAFALLLLINRE
jgi:hypothetical protein